VAEEGHTGAGEGEMASGNNLNAIDGGAVSHPVPRKKERSLHTCAQDVQITRTANNMVNRYNISLNYKLESLQMTRGSKRNITEWRGNLSIGASSTGTTGGEAGLVFIFGLPLVLLVLTPTFDLT
jgi:hypothetical protein